MGTLSDYATTELVDHVFKAAYTPAATLYMALCTTTPTAASTGSTIVETNYTSYARKSFTATTFGAAGAITTRMIKQILDVEFVQATGDGSLPVTGYAICDAATNGNMLAFGAFNSSFSVVSGNTPKIASGQIDISIGASSGAGFTDIATEKMLDLMFRNTAWTSPATGNDLHFGATTATIADTDTLATITEATGGSYAREPVPASSFDAAVAGVTTNNTIITFDAPSGDWSGGSNITSLFICDALSGTGDDLLAYDNTNVVDQPVGLGDTVNIQSGSFDCNLD